MTALPHPAATYEFPCPNCGVGMPAELPLDHPAFHPLEPVVLSFDCATCGRRYSTARNEDGTCRDVSRQLPAPATDETPTPEGGA